MQTYADIEVEFDPTDPRYIDDPYPTLNDLREHHPIFWHPTLESWVLTRYDDCREVATDSSRFASDRRRIGEDVPDAALSIQTIDPPEHTELRRLLSAMLRVVDLKAMQDVALQWTQDLVSAWGDASSVDAISDYAIPLSTITTGYLMGIDALHDDEITSASKDIIVAMMAPFVDGAAERGMRARRTVSERLGELYRQAPMGTPLGEVRSAAADSSALEEHVVNSLRAFYLAGINSAHRFVGNALLAMASQPGALGAFGTLQSRVDTMTALNELVRFDPPVQAMERVCVADTEVAGRPVCDGETVTMLIGGANRDPRRFDKPDELVLTRRPNPHLGFGRGPHTCLGVGTLTFQTAGSLRLVAQAFPDATISDTPVREQNPSMRGLATLPLTPRPRLLSSWRG